MGESSTIYVIIQLEPKSIGEPLIRAVCANLSSAEEYIRSELRQHPEITLELDVSEVRY